MNETYVEIRYRCENFRMSWYDYSAFASASGLNQIDAFKPKIVDGSKGVVELDDVMYLKFGRKLIHHDILISEKNGEGIQHLLLPRKAEEKPSPNRVSLDMVVEAENIDPAVEAVMEEDPHANLSDTQLLINITRKELNREMGYFETENGAPVYVGKN